MSIIDRLACTVGTNSEIPNQELAKDLVQMNDTEGISEVVENLRNGDPRIQSDCIKVLYEIGYLHPALISEYVLEFLELLKTKNNRLIWGGMIAISTIAGIQAQTIFANLDSIYSAIENGSVITRDNGIKTLAAVAAKDEEYNTAIFPYLCHILRNCRPKDLPQYAESILPTINPGNRESYLNILKEREASLTPAQMQRLKKTYKTCAKI